MNNLVGPGPGLPGPPGPPAPPTIVADTGTTGTTGTGTGTGPVTGTGTGTTVTGGTGTTVTGTAFDCFRPHASSGRPASDDDAEIDASICDPTALLTAIESETINTELKALQVESASAATAGNVCV